MSIGFMIPEDAPTVWRGPMVMSAMEKMLHQVNWGVLDILLLDMPPGTGDTHLTVAQRVPVSGAVIISTPQDIALIDARRGINMFHNVDIPILGLVENMSYFVCPSCGTHAHIFGHEGAKDAAQEMGVEFLGEIPLHETIRRRSDEGSPIVFSEPDSPQAQHYLQIADKVAGHAELQLFSSLSSERPVQQPTMNIIMD